MQKKVFGLRVDVSCWSAVVRVVVFCLIVLHVVFEVLHCLKSTV